MQTNRFIGFKYIFSQAAKRDLKKLDKQIVKKIIIKLDELVTGREGLDIKAMINVKSPQYRLRVGDYRVIFEELRNEIIIVIISVGHRKEIYKKKMR
ncbi:MAG: type II toxin-antitoxin system RelE/ParE family toxin [Candidatus Babeliales bacterium]